jgi:hypothetical protein
MAGLGNVVGVDGAGAVADVADPGELGLNGTLEDGIADPGEVEPTAPGELGALRPDGGAAALDVDPAPGITVGPGEIEDGVAPGDGETLPGADVPAPEEDVIELAVLGVVVFGIMALGVVALGVGTVVLDTLPVGLHGCVDVVVVEGVVVVCGPAVGDEDGAAV